MTLGEFSILLSTIGVIPYIWQIIQGMVRPHRFSWLVWTIILTFTLWGYVSAGGKDSTWFIAGDLLITTTVFILSLWRGRGGHEKLDVICLMIAFFGIVLWQVSQLPLIALLGTMIADMMGIVLTVKKALIDPTSESATTFAWSSAAAVCGFIDVGEWNLLLMTYPLYLFIANFVTTLVIVVSRYQLRHLARMKSKKSKSAALAII